MVNYIGSTLYYEIKNVLYTGIITHVEYHEGLGKMVYSAVSPFGNKFRLSESEIKLIVI